MDITDQSTIKSPPFYRKYWFAIFTTIWFLIGTVFLTNEIKNLIETNSLRANTENLIIYLAFFVIVWLFFAGIKIKKPSILFAHNQRIVRFLLIISAIVFLLLGFPFIILAVSAYVLPLGVALVIHLIFTFIFLWRLPVKKELWEATNKTKFFVRFSILVSTGIILWWFAFTIANGID